MGYGSILIIDDDPVFLEEMGTVLSGAGFAVEKHPSGAGALEKTRECRPDIVLLDLKLNGMSGFEVAEQLKSCPQTLALPIIGVSGHYIRSEHLLVAQMSQMEDLVKKPVDPEHMINVLTRAMGKER